MCVLIGCCANRECPSHRWSEETSQIPTWNRCSPRNPKIPENDRTSHPKVAVPASRTRNRTRLQDRSAIPIVGCVCSSRSIGSLPRWTVRGHQLVRYPRQEGDYHAKGHPVGSPNPWRTRVNLRSTTFITNRLFS